MPQSNQIEKIKGHTKLLIKVFLRLQQRYVMLEPMLYKESVTSRYNESENLRISFGIIQDSLADLCIQNSASILSGKYDSELSIFNVLNYLKDQNILNDFRCSYISQSDSESDKKSRENDFDNYYKKVTEIWRYLESNDQIKKFKKHRDKTIAHFETRSDGSGYRLYDANTDNLINGSVLTYGDITNTIDHIREMIELLNIIVNGKHYHLGIQFYSGVSRSFWEY